MQNLVRELRDKSIHIVGVTGAEGSSILRFLVKHNIKNITVHDFLKEKTVEKSFRLWHKGLSTYAREELFKQFTSDLSLTQQKFNFSYLADIKSADIIFVPQSWRLYKEENHKLWRLADKIPFYSLTRLYLDFAPAKIIAVTGTVGKGSTANIIYQWLKQSGKKVFFAGNETWMIQLADKLDEMTADDILVLEISHRQLLDGFTRAPAIVVVTNLYPNHLDEVSWEDYTNLKLSLLKRQAVSDTSILNYDIDELRLKDKLKSKVIYFSGKSPEMNTKNIQRVYSSIMNMKSDHYLPNLLAGLTVVDFLGIDIGGYAAILTQIKSLPGRLELLKIVNGINVYNDIKSTTPWATLAGVAKLGRNTVLICGGRVKGIDYKEFADKIAESVKFVVLLKSELSQQIKKVLPDGTYQEVDDLKQALNVAYMKTSNNDNILISPAAGFFYSDFIRGKESIKKIITSLPPKEPV